MAYIDSQNTYYLATTTIVYEEPFRLLHFADFNESHLDSIYGLRWTGLSNNATRDD